MPTIAYVLLVRWSILSPLSGALFVVSSLCAQGVLADEPEEKPPEPVFAGHRYLSVYTKEVSLEGHFTRLGDGSLVASGGATMGAFYSRWFGVIGAANFTPPWFNSRQHYDTRGGIRLTWPEPIGGRLFPFVSTGFTVVFYETEKGSDVFKRGAGAFLGIGAFFQVTEKFRIRVEVRDHWLPGSTHSEMAHNLFCTLALAMAIR